MSSCWKVSELKNQLTRTRKKRAGDSKSKSWKTNEKKSKRKRERKKEIIKKLKGWKLQLSQKENFYSVAEERRILEIFKLNIVNENNSTNIKI